MSIRDKDPAMSDTILDDMQRIARLAAEPRLPGDTAKAAIGRAAKRLKLTYRRARSFWYATPDAAVRALEADRLRAEELTILANRRWRLEQEMLMIEARLNAREMGQNAGLACEERRSDLPLGSASADKRVSVAGEAGVIPDPRQLALRGVR